MKFQPTMDWGNPAARASLISMVGVAEYGQRLEAAQKAATIDVVNGYTLRHVSSGFGPLVAVLPGRSAFKTVEAARDYARSLRPHGEPVKLLAWPELAALKVGQRVRFGQSWDIFPHTVVRQGEMGTVVYNGLNEIWAVIEIRPDCPKVRAALTEWDGKVMLTPEDASSFGGVSPIEVVS